MGRIDPKELLGLFRADLTAEGGIRCDPAVVHKFCGATSSYGKKLVSRCVYLNILKNTDPQALELYLAQKGWQTLNTWLKDAKEDNNQPFVQELMDLLILCPVTVDRLRVTDTAKIVKALRKEGNTAAVIDRANRLYDKWLHVIGASHASAVTAPAAGDAAAAAAGATDATVVNGGSKAKKAKVRKGSVDGNDSSSNSSDVVMNGGGSGATGRAGVTAASSSSVTSTGVLTTSSGNKVPGSSSSTDTNAHHAVQTAVTMTPSDAFMASLEPVVMETPKRKKKPTHESESANKKTKTNTLSTESNAAAVGAASDAASSASMADPDDLLSSIIEQDMSVDAPIPDPIARSVSDAPVTPTTPPAVVSPSSAFSSTGGPLNNMTSTPTSSRALNPTFTTPVNAPPSSSLSSSSSLMTPGPDKSYPRGCLHYSSSGKKKSVRWLPDESMTRVKYFETAVDERVNVWRQSLQQNNTQNENRLAEGQAFKDRSNGEAGADGASPAAPKSTWVPLQVIEFREPPTVVRGSGSLEKSIERRRQSTILADIYISKEMIPDAPAEPDNPVPGVSLAEAKMIPLEDPTGGNVLTDHSKTPLPAPRNNPLFGEAFLQPHQMALDHSIHHNNPATAHLPHVIGGGGGASTAGPGANGPIFQSSYVEPQGPHQRPFVKSHLGPAHANGGGRGALGPNHAANAKGNNSHNGGGGAGGGNKPFLADLRNSKGQKVCGFFYNSGNCYRANCHFLHTREDVTDWGGNNFNNMQKFKQTV